MSSYHQWPTCYVMSSTCGQYGKSRVNLECACVDMLDCSCQEYVGLNLINTCGVYVEPLKQRNRCLVVNMSL